MKTRQVLAPLAAAVLLAAVLLPLGTVFLFSVAVLLIPIVPIAVFAGVVMMVGWVSRGKPAAPHAPSARPRKMVYAG